MAKGKLTPEEKIELRKKAEESFRQEAAAASYEINAVKQAHEKLGDRLRDINRM